MGCKFTKKKEEQNELFFPCAIARRFGMKSVLPLISILQYHKSPNMSILNFISISKKGRTNLKFFLFL